jgi:hypothetical protein
MVENKYNSRYLGMRAKDMLTGVKGIIVAGDEWLNGCVRYGIKLEKVDKDGKEFDTHWVDAVYVEIIDETTPFTKEVKKTGGPRQCDTFR